MSYGLFDGLPWRDDSLTEEDIQEARAKFFSNCMHDNCLACDGTGSRKDGLGPCVHMMSCPCPKCSPRM